MLPLMKPTGFLAAKVLTSSLSFIGIRAYEEGLVVRNPTIFSRGRLRACAIPILYSALIGTGMGTVMQIIGQRTVDPAIASIIMSFTAAFATIMAVPLLNEIPSLREYAGCALLFLAILISQKPDKISITSSNRCLQ